jgi:type IV fimbrial biogenesis protein FimT
MFFNAASTKLHLVTRRTGRSPCHSATAGFTVVELMITVTMVGILAAVAIPSMRTFMQNDRQWTQSSSLIMALNTARNEAIKQDTGVQVCPSANQTACDPAGAWAEGWIVLSTSPTATTPIMTAGPLPTGTTLTEATGQVSVTFLSTGAAQTAAAFTMCDARGATYGRYTQITKPGSVTSSLGKKLNGTALACP